VDKRTLAAYLSCSVRSLNTLVAEGMPHAILVGKVKFRVSEVEAWLEASGRLERRGSLVAPEHLEAA
jgi:hypothetical protein